MAYSDPIDAYVANRWMGELIRSIDVLGSDHLYMLKTMSYPAEVWRLYQQAVSEGRFKGETKRRAKSYAQECIKEYRTTGVPPVRFPEARHWDMTVDRIYVDRISWVEKQEITAGGKTYDAYQAVVTAREDFRPSQLRERPDPPG